MAEVFYSKDLKGLPENFADRMAIFDNMPLAEIVRYQAEARGISDRLKEEQKQAEKWYDFISIFVLPEKMEDEAMETMKVAGIGRVSLRGDMQCSTAKGMQPNMLAWCRENDMEDLITEGVNGSTMKAFVKEQMGKGKDGNYPEELLNIYPYTRAVITKT